MLIGDALWLPNTERPEWLDGSMPGDRGFDPLGLAKPASYLQARLSCRPVTTCTRCIRLRCVCSFFPVNACTGCSQLSLGAYLGSGLGQRLSGPLPTSWYVLFVV